MAGKIIADTLETGAGADIATSYVVNGSAKAWVNLDATGTPAARDSLNLSTITDNAAGDFTLNWSSSMDNANYSATGMTANFTISSTNTCVLGTKNLVAPTTSAINLTTARTSATSTTEREYNFTSIFGDLA